MSGDHHLVRRVQIRSAYHFPLRSLLQNAMQRAFGQTEQRGHRAQPGRHGFLHVAAALADQAHGIRELQAAGRYQSGVFSQAVAGHVVRHEAAFRQHAKGGGGNREQRRLRVLRQLERIFRSLET